jgi:hypothetical protein
VINVILKTILTIFGKKFFLDLFDKKISSQKVGIISQLTSNSPTEYSEPNSSIFIAEHAEVAFKLQAEVIASPVVSVVNELNLRIHRYCRNKNIGDFPTTLFRKVEGDMDNYLLSIEIEHSDGMLIMNFSLSIEDDICLIIQFDEMKKWLLTELMSFIDENTTNYGH